MKRPIYLSFFNALFVLLAAFFIIRLSFSLLIFYWDVPQTDDFCFMARMHEYGFWGSLHWWYFQWQGRFLPQLLTNIVMVQYNLFDSMLLYGIFLSTLFIFAIYQLITHTLSNTGIELKIKEKLLVGLFSGILFCFILDYHTDSSTFYWINVSTMYFSGIAFFILGVAELLNKKNNKASYLALCFSFIYAGCSAEHVGVLVLGFLVISYIIQKKLTFLSINYFKQEKLIVAFFSCLVSFLLMYFAPGNAFRLASTEQPDFSDGLLNIARFTSIFYFNRLTENSGYLILGFLLSIWIGSYFRDRIHIDQQQLKKIIFTNFLTLIYFTVGSIIIFGFLVNYNAPSRAFVHISALLVLFIGLLGFILGLTSQSRQITFIHQIALLVFLIYGTTVLYKYKFYLNPTIDYAKSVRNRIKDIKEIKQDTSKYMVLPKLTSSDKNMLLDGEMAFDQNDINLFWINKCINTAYGLNKDHVIIVDSDDNDNSNNVNQ